MPTEVFMPALGMSQDTGRLIAWLKKEGESVNKGDILMEVETDKATVEVEATASGTLVNVTAQEGADVPVGEVIAFIIAPDETAPKSANETESMSASARVTVDDGAVKASSPVGVTPVAMRAAKELGVDVRQVQAQGKRVTRADVEAYADGMRLVLPGRILASPKARRLAHERGLDLTALTGNGPDGAILAADVLSTRIAVATTSPSQPEQVETQQTPAQTGSMWRRMAERLTESWQTVPHFYLKRDVSAQALVIWRQNIQRRTDTKITYTDLLVKLVAAALQQHSHVNGQWNGETVIFNEQINIGLAVAVDEGLIVPVVHTADKLGVVAIAERRSQIVERAQNNKLRPNDLQDGTFTISNLGMYGIDEFSAIVNPPQAAILAVGSISDRIVPVNGQPVVLPMMTLSLSCDHRAVDGARGAQFLDTLVSLITDPLGLID